MNHFSYLQNDLYDKATLYIPVDVRKGRLVYKTASCLEGECSSFLQMTPKEVHNEQSSPVHRWPQSLDAHTSPLGQFEWGPRRQLREETPVSSYCANWMIKYQSTQSSSNFLHFSPILGEIWTTLTLGITQIVRWKPTHISKLFQI